MKKRIYLVEDNDDINELISYLLSQSGFDVHTYTTITAFKQRMQTLLPDLIILDIMLPDGSGVDVCKSLKSTGPEKAIPVLLMSAQTNGRLLAKEAHADDFIGKPFDIDELIKKVQQQVA